MWWEVSLNLIRCIKLLLGSWNRRGNFFRGKCKNVNHLSTKTIVMKKQLIMPVHVDNRKVVTALSADEPVRGGAKGWMSAAMDGSGSVIWTCAPSSSCRHSSSLSVTKVTFIDQCLFRPPPLRAFYTLRLDHSTRSRCVLVSSTRPYSIIFKRYSQELRASWNVFVRS